MDQRELHRDDVETIRTALEGWQQTIFTMLPGKIIDYDPSENTCSIQSQIQGQWLDNKGNTRTETLPKLIHCPVMFVLGGGFVITTPVAAGDECTIFFAQRCIDGWWQQGSMQLPMEFRLHDISDGFVFPGVFSKPNVPSNISTTNLQIRNLDGDAFLEFTPDKKMNATFPGGINLNGVSIDSAGNVLTAGEVTAKTDHTVSQHTHTQPDDSDGDTEEPTNTPTG